MLPRSLRTSWGRQSMCHMRENEGSWGIDGVHVPLELEACAAPRDSPCKIVCVCVCVCVVCSV